MSELTAYCCEQVHRLAPSQRLSFGGGPGVDLVLATVGIPAMVGGVVAGDAYWSVENVGGRTPIVVENRHGNGHDFVKVTEGRSAPVPFTAARVLVLGTAGVVGFDVRTDLYAAEPDEVRSPDATALLDENTKYFQVLVALCEPALRHRTTTVIPTTSQIVDRLRRLPSCRQITTTAVDFHLNYLQTTKLKAQVQAYSTIRGMASREGGQHRRAQLVDLALRFDLVAERHLSLLEPAA